MGVTIPEFDEATDGASDESTTAFFYDTTNQIFNITSAAYGIEEGAFFRLAAYLHIIKAAYDPNNVEMRDQIYIVMRQDSETAVLPSNIIDPLLRGLEIGLPTDEMAQIIWEFTKAISVHLANEDGS